MAKQALISMYVLRDRLPYVVCAPGRRIGRLLRNGRKAKDKR